MNETQRSHPFSSKANWQFNRLFLLLLPLLAGCVTSNDEPPVLPTSAGSRLVLVTAVPPAPAAPLPPARIIPPTATPASSKTPTPLASALLVATYAPFIEDFSFLTITPTTTRYSSQQRLGYSVQQRQIVAYRFGNGPTPIVFIGGMHGGYEWNTILLAYAAVDFLEANPSVVLPSATAYIIPSANPDGQFLVTGREGRFTAADVVADPFQGRFNGNGVDLNRNWDCNWTADGRWRQETINAGTAPFSEPENQVLRDFMLQQRPAAVVFWHSAANGIFAAGCPELYRPSRQLAEIYGHAAGYPVYDFFTSYAITGDASDWLATQGIPAITVELRNHQDLDWSQNRAGLTAVLRYYGR
jgi:predicted deacylase